MQMCYCHHHKSLLLHWNFFPSAFCFTLLMPLTRENCACATYVLCLNYCPLPFWQMLRWKTVQESEKHYHMIFFPQVSFLPVGVSMVCTAMPTITCKAPCCLLLGFFNAALGWLIKKKKPQKLAWTYNPNRGHPFWEEFWPQGFDHEQPFQLSHRFGTLYAGQMLPSAAFPSHCKASWVLWPHLWEALGCLGASPVHCLGTSQFPLLTSGYWLHLFWKVRKNPPDS